MASWTVLTHEADGMNIMAMHITLVPGKSGNLEGAADGSVNNMRTVPGTVSVNGSKHPTTVLGQPGYDVEARIDRDRGGPGRLMVGVCRADRACARLPWWHTTATRWPAS